jgi:hypothetical protein
MAANLRSKRLFQPAAPRKSHAEIKAAGGPHDRTAAWCEISRVQHGSARGSTRGDHLAHGGAASYHLSSIYYGREGGRTCFWSPSARCSRQHGTGRERSPPMRLFARLPPALMQATTAAPTAAAPQHPPGCALLGPAHEAGSTHPHDLATARPDAGSMHPRGQLSTSLHALLQPPTPANRAPPRWPHGPSHRASASPRVLTPPRRPPRAAASAPLRRRSDQAWRRPENPSRVGNQEAAVEVAWYFSLEQKSMNWWKRENLRLPAVGTLKRYFKALEYEYRVKTAALVTLKRYSIFSLTLYLEWYSAFSILYSGGPH